MGFVNTKGFNVYKNDIFQFFISGRSQSDCKKALDRISIGTHMFEWLKRDGICPITGDQTASYEYCTTVGVYVRFEPAFISVEL
jgi:hypothetical protein